MNIYFTRGEIQMVKISVMIKKKQLKQEWDSILYLIWLETDQCFSLTMI